jgi:flagellar hook-length control protein FliK
MNATLALHAAAPTTASITTSVTPVADAVLAPGASDAAHPLFSLMLGQAPAEDAESADTPEAADAAIAPWLMALDSQQAPALPFTQPFSRLLGAAAREAAPEGAPAEAGADIATPSPIGHVSAALASAPDTAQGRSASVPAVAAPVADGVAGADPAPAPDNARQRASADAAARALPAEALSAAMAPRPTREAGVSLDGFATVLNANPGSSASSASDPVVRLDAQRSELWQRPLAQALGDRVQWQSTQGIDQARIRLDPPALGRIEIVVRQEGAQLQVQLTASSPEVARQLQHMGDGLRQELGQRQGQSVQVQVQPHDGGAQADARGQQRQGQTGRDEADPGQALRGEHDPSRRFTLA